MSTLTKVFVVLVSLMAFVNGALSIASAARWSNVAQQLKTYGELYQGELARRMQAEGGAAALLAVKDDLIAAQAKSLADRDQQNSEFTRQLAALQIDLARQTNDRTAAEAGRKKLEEILEVQTAELTGAQKQNEVLLTENIDLQTRIQRLSGRVLELTSQNTIAGDEIRNLQQKLYAEQDRNRGRTPEVSGYRAAADLERETPVGVRPVLPAVAGPINGEVVQSDGRYANINVGETSGVVAGLTFMVYRGSQYLGDLVIDTVHPKEAGGKITLLAAGASVQRGDKVAYGIE